MTDDDMLRDRIAEAIWDERTADLPAARSTPNPTHQMAYCHRLADAVIAALNLKANPDPIGARPGLFISGWIE